MYYDDESVLHLEEKDKCYDCAQRLVVCPLIESLMIGLTVLTDKFDYIHDCGLYRPRHLSIVPSVAEVSPLVKKDKT